MTFPGPKLSTKSDICIRTGTYTQKPALIYKFYCFLFACAFYHINSFTQQTVKQTLKALGTVIPMASYYCKLQGKLRMLFHFFFF